MAVAEPLTLTGDAIKTTLGGSRLELDTPLGTTLPIEFQTNGLMSGTAGSLASYLGAEKDRGRWWVVKNQLCYKWFRWFEAQSRCLSLRVKGPRVFWRQDDGKRGTATIARPAQPIVAEAAPAARSKPAVTSVAAVKPAPEAAPKILTAPKVMATDSALPAMSPSYTVASAVPPRRPIIMNQTVTEPRPSAAIAVAANFPMPQRRQESDGVFHVGAHMSPVLGARARRMQLEIVKAKAAAQNRNAKLMTAWSSQNATATVGDRHDRRASGRRYPVYAVTGVDIGDVLNIRRGPTPDHPIVGAIPPTGRGIRLTGACVGGWCPVEFRGVNGWVNSFYLEDDALAVATARQ